MEQDQLTVKEEAQAYVVPWKPIDNWVGVILLILVNAALLLIAMQGINRQVAQSAVLIAVQLLYLVPVLVIFVYRQVHIKNIGFGGFRWQDLALGCGLMIGGYMFILVHNSLLLLLGLDTQGEMVMQMFNEMESPAWFVLVGVIFAPFVEELFFRGFLFQGFRAQYGWVRSAFISSAVFGIAHMDPSSLLPTFVLGLVLAYMYHRTNSIWPGVILHLSMNAFSFCVLFAMMQNPSLIPV